MPTMQRAEKVNSAVCMLERNCGCVCWVTAWSAIKMEKMTVIIVMLAIMPRVRMVLFRPEATPRKRGGTLPIMTLIFGEEKSAKPRPRVANIIMIRVIDVVAVIVAAMARPAAQRPMPMVATVAAEKRSASRPHNGEKVACTIG